jgi:hypothetical protein
MDNLENLSKTIAEQIGRRRFLSRAAAASAGLLAALLVPFVSTQAFCGVHCTGLCGFPCYPPLGGVRTNCHDNCTGQNYVICQNAHACGGAGYCASTGC